MSKHKKPRVREAKPGDRSLFKKMWTELLEDQNKKGFPVKATENNVEVYAKIFDAYVGGRLKGIVLFIAEDAVLMWGERGVDIFDTEWDDAGQGWGTYVRARARKKGYSKLIREVAVKKMKELGIKMVLGTGIHGNDEGVTSGQKFGFVPHSTVHILTIS